MQLSNIKSATIATLRAFVSENNLIIEGDRRLRSTYEKAISLFLAAKEEAVLLAKETVEGAIVCVKEAVTYDNAVIAANWLNVNVPKATIVTARFLRSALLVMIGLVLVLIEMWNDRDEIVLILKGKRDRLISKLSFVWQLCRQLGKATIEDRILEPIEQKKALIRERLGVALRANE